MSSIDGIPAENLEYKRCEACNIEWIRHKGIIPTCLENQKLKAKIKDLEKEIKDIKGGLC